MGSQQFCLKWNNHQANMLTVFEHLLSSEALVDVTLACEGLSLKAHKMVLSACSPFFQSLFLENPCKHPIVIMKDMRYTDLKAIIDFMYRGEVNVSQDQLSALLKTAETLKVKGLAEVTGENKAGPNSLVKEELVKGSSVSASSGPSTQNRAESPPLSRRKRGRPRRRSLSGSNRSDSEDVPSKIIKEPDSPEVIEDMSRDGVSEPLEVHSRLNTNHTPSQVSSHLPSVHSSLKSLPSVLPQSETHVTVEEPPSGDEGEFDVEPSKLMEQTLTTDNMVYPDGPTPAALPPVSSIPSSESQSHTNQGQSIENQALVPCSMPSDPSTSSHITDDSSQDIKPHNLVSYEEPQMSPIAGTSHQDNSNSSMMMYLDTSGVPAIPGPSNYQLDKQSPSQQPQEFKFMTSSLGAVSTKKEVDLEANFPTVDPILERKGPLITTSPAATKDKRPVEKPPFYMTQLIIQALAAAPDRKLTVTGIYNYITRHYPYYRANKETMRRQVRNTLASLSHFTKEQGLSCRRLRGTYWKMVPHLEQELITKAFCMKTRIHILGNKQREDMTHSQIPGHLKCESFSESGLEQPETLSRALELGIPRKGRFGRTYSKSRKKSTQEVLSEVSGTTLTSEDQHEMVDNDISVTPLTSNEMDSFYSSFINNSANKEIKSKLPKFSPPTSSAIDDLETESSPEIEHNHIQYKVNDLVLLRRISTTPGSHKLKESWEGPYRVTKQIDQLNYELEHPQNDFTEVAHTDNLKLQWCPCHDHPDLETRIIQGSGIAASPPPGNIDSDSSECDLGQDDSFSSAEMSSRKSTRKRKQVERYVVQ